MRAARACFIACFALAALSGCREPTQARAAAPAEQAAEARLDEVEISTERRQVAPPAAGSPRAQALAALAQATQLELYSLRPIGEPEAPPRPGQDDAAAEAAWQAAWQEARVRWEKQQCRARGCLHRNEILGHVTVAAGRPLQAVTTALEHALGGVPDYEAACEPAFRHAVRYNVAGRQYDILLCYGCGQVAVAIDGEPVEYGQADRMGEEGALDAILSRAGIALAPKG